MLPRSVRSDVDLRQSLYRLRTTNVNINAPMAPGDRRRHLLRYPVRPFFTLPESVLSCRTSHPLFTGSLSSQWSFKPIALRIASLRRSAGNGLIKYAVQPKSMARCRCCSSWDSVMKMMGSLKPNAASPQRRLVFVRQIFASPCQNLARSQIRAAASEDSAYCSQVSAHGVCCFKKIQSPVVSGMEGVKLPRPGKPPVVWGSGGGGPRPGSDAHRMRTVHSQSSGHVNRSNRRKGLET